MRMRVLLFGGAVLFLMANMLHSVEFVKVKTKAPHNRFAIFNYRIPKTYDRKLKTKWRVLVIFGGRNTDGKADATGRMGWGKWCDKNRVFIVSPGLVNDKYWEPDEWSGKALKKALKLIKREYKICDDKLLFYGYSAGSQASNLFPAWEHDMCRAWVSHACGVFHEPNYKMRDIPGLVTCGDADSSRYIISRDFVEKARKKNINIIWKSFPNHPHDVPPASLALARAFLQYYHEKHSQDLTPSLYIHSPNIPQGAAFIGDDQEHEYYIKNSAKAKNVLSEDKVILPNESIAKAWGSFAK